MKNILRASIFSLVLILILSGFTPPKPEADVRSIVDKMVNAMASYNTITFTLKRKERFGSSYKEGKLFAKIQEKPRKVYVKNHFPDPDSEVLWVSGNNKALINPAKFPWVNLNLDPYGDIMMKDQHHSVHELGFGITLRIVRDALKRHGDKFEQYVSYKGQVNWDGRPCHMVVIDYPEWSYVPYTVQAGENLFTIAKRLVVSEFLIMEKNKGIADYLDVKAGQTIQIPNVYAKKSILLIDTQTYIPLVQEVQDERGMFERYEYTGLKVNPAIAPAEFTEDYNGYGF